MKVRTLINVVPFEENIRYKRVTYEQVKKSCGKSGCRTCGGTRLAHGPYWQLVEWDEAGRKKRTRYIGKELSPETEEALVIKRFLTDPDFRRLIHATEELLQDRERRRKEIAYLNQKIARLEADLVSARAKAAQSPPFVFHSPTIENATKIYRKLAAKYHPDRNPAGAELMKDINELWQALKIK
jgi:hypothetical protein